MSVPLAERIVVFSCGSTATVVKTKEVRSRLMVGSGRSILFLKNFIFPKQPYFSVQELR